MKLRLPLLLRLALLSTAAAYTLGSGCLFADDAPADAAQDDPIAEAVDEEESDSPAIGFEGYTESQLVDIQSSDSAGAVIRQMLENSTTGAVANVGTTTSSSNGATAAAESPALTLSAPAGPAADTTLTTSTLSDSAGEGAAAPFFSAEEAAALVVASPATSTPSLKNASTATLSSSDASDETTSSAAANGAASSSLGSVGSASAGGAGASSGGGSASYSLTSSAPDSSSSSLVTTTPTDDTSSDPIAEDVLEDSTTEDTTTSTTLPDSSASTLAGTSSTSATPRTLPQMKLLGSTEPASVSTFSLSTSVNPTVFTFEGAPVSRTDSAYHTASGVSTSGTVTYSASNQGVGTAYGSYYLVRDLGQAADFGSDGYIKINDGYWKTGGDCTLSTTSAFTITTYVKLTTIEGEQTFFSTGSNNQYGFAFGLKDGKFDFLRKNKDHDCLDPSLGLIIDTWYNMTLSYDGNGTAIFYLNGEKIGERTISTATGDYAAATGDHASIGSSTYESKNNHLNGSMADLRIYSGAATAQEIRNAAGLGILWNGTSANSVWDYTQTNWKGGGSDSLAFRENDSVVFSAEAGNGIATTVTVGENLAAYGIGVADGSFTLTAAEETSHSLSVQEVNVGSSASLTIGTGVTLNVLDGALITLGSGATASFAGTTTINGVMTVSGGALELSGTITNRGTKDNLRVENGGSYKINVSSENALIFDGFSISKNGEASATLSCSGNDSLSLHKSTVTYSDATLVKQDGAEPKTINATLQNVDFTNCEGSGETKFTGIVSFSSLNNLGSKLVITGNAAITESLSTVSTISNSGTIALGSGVSLSFDFLENLEKWYYDSKFETGTVLNSGYLSGRYLIKGGTVSKTDETVSATCGDNSYALDFSTVAGAVLTAGSARDCVYYISSGDSLLYGDTGNSMADEATTSIVLNGGTLQLGETALGKAVGLSQASTLQLNEGATFAASSVVASNAQQSGQIATNGNTLSLSGSGTYTISLNSGNQFTSSSLGSNVQLKTGDDGWKGTITLTGGSSIAGYPHNLTGLFNGAYSIIEMKGVTGWTDTWGGTEAANIKLTDVTDGSTTTYAWTNGAYVSGDGATRTCTFTGTWSGKGTFCADTGTATNGTHKQNYTYQGDISGWTGRFLLDKAIMTMTLRFADKANKVNAEIKQNKGTLNITAAATGGTTFANAIKASSLTATTALKLSAKKEGENYVDTADTLTGALNASGQAVTIDNALVTLKVNGATTAASFSNAGNAYLNGGAVITGVLSNTGTLSLGGTSTAASFSNAGTANLNGGAVITGVLSNTGTLSLGGTSTVGKIEGAATVSGNLTLTGVNSVYHSGSALNFSGSSTLTLGTGATATNPFIYSDRQSFKVGLISGSILNGSTVALQGLSGRQTATYSGEGDDAVITINGGPLNLEWNNSSGGVWSTDTTSEKNWIAGETEEYFYSGDHVTIGAYSVTTSGNLVAGNVALNGATLTIAGGSSLTANSMTISGVTTIDNSANTSVYTQNSVTLSNGTSLTLKNTNLTAGGTTAGGTLTVDGNGTLTLISSSVLRDLFINGGIVKTDRSDNGTAQISGTVTVKAGGTYLVSGTKDDGLGWGENATRAINLLAGDENTHAVLDLNGKRSTATTVLYLNGYATVQNGIWDPFGTNSEQKGGTINVSGTGNVIASDVKIRFRERGGVVFDIGNGADIEMRGVFTQSGASDDVKTLTKKGNGLLTITGASDISGNTVSVQAGTLKLAGTAGKVGSGAITLGSNAVLELAHAADCTLSNSISSAEDATGTTLRVSGTAVETLSGTVDVAVTDIQSGTLTFNGSSASLGALTVGDGAGLSATGSSQTLNLSAVVENQGTLNLNGVSTLTFTVSDVFDSFSYTDAVTGAGAKNGFIDRYWLIRNSGSGAIENLSVGDVTVNGTSKDSISDTTGLYAAVEAADLGVTDGTNLNSIYVVNEGNVVYNAASNSSGNDTVKQLWLTGGTLVLDQSDIKSGVGVHVKQDSTVNIGVDRTLTDSQVSSVENGATLTLTGSGTYSISAGEAAITSMTSGVAVGTGESGFSGTVLLNYGVTLADADLNVFANGSSSSVKMNGVSGTLKSGEISTNLVLEDYFYSEINEGQVDARALIISGAGSIMFSGSISGTGEMKIAPSDAAAENTIIFSGDVSGWTGKLEVAEGKANVTFTGEAKEINASVVDALTPELNVVVDASESRTFTKGITADSMTLTGGDAAKTVSIKGDSVQYIIGSVDLKEENVILQVSGTGTTCLYASNAELAGSGSSSINIADNSGVALTTIRTNTVDTSSPNVGSINAKYYFSLGYSNSDSSERAVISNATIDRAVIDVVNGSTLELSSVVLTNSCWVHDDDASTPTPTGNLVLNGVELQMAKGSASTEDGSGVALTLTGGTTVATNADGSEKTLTGKVYVMVLTQISDFATISGSGSGLTLNFDTYGNGFAELYETLKGYDYVAVKFSDDVLSVDFESLKVTSKITNGQNDVATSQGYYYNNNGTSGVVVYFDAIALPEPTTSTLGLLALAALCARRRRSRTRAHAE